MAVTTTTPTLISGSKAFTNKFCVNAYSADWSGTEEIAAAPSAGSLYITKLKISCVSAINITIGAGENSGAVTTALLGPLYFGTALPGSIEYDWGKDDMALKVGAVTSLTADSSGAGAANIYVEGFIG